MIVEARCSECGERIGYVSTTIYLSSLKKTGLTKIAYHGVSISFLCDKCRQGRFDLDEVKKEEGRS